MEEEISKFNFMQKKTKKNYLLEHDVYLLLALGNILQLRDFSSKYSNYASIVLYKLIYIIQTID